MIIKVCGMRKEENIQEVEALGIDMMGFIFYPKSSRYVSERPGYLPQKCKRVGVFVDATIEDILQRIADYGLDIIQLHGHESPDFIRQLRSLCGNSIATIKAFNIATKEDLEATAPYASLVDFFLFDTRATVPAGSSQGEAANPSAPAGPVLLGGTGTHFDWSLLTAYDGDTPFLLSGGIGPDDAPRLRQTLALDGFPVEKFLGLDLNSRFEIEPGIKDMIKLKTFLNDGKQNQ